MLVDKKELLRIRDFLVENCSLFSSEEKEYWEIDEKEQEISIKLFSVPFFSLSVRENEYGVRTYTANLSYFSPDDEILFLSITESDDFYLREELGLSYEDDLPEEKVEEILEARKKEYNEWLDNPTLVISSLSKRVEISTNWVEINPDEIGYIRSTEFTIESQDLNDIVEILNQIDLFEEAYLKYCEALRKRELETDGGVREFSMENRRHRNKLYRFIAFISSIFAFILFLL